ncbi:MAG: ribokinase [Synechococcales bacterium]|nr:ribokinase [Synechococcales bacterium]
MSIVVFGSLNMDLVTCTDRLPHPGETLMGQQFFTTPGGKGANQAVAAAKLGVPTVLIGRVGNDGFGTELLTGLRSQQIQIDDIGIDSSTHTGVAIINVADNGENQIIGVAGANGRLDESDIAKLQVHLPRTKLLLLQLEVNLSAIRLAIQTAHQAGIPIILDPAPVPTEAIADLYPLVDILVPNEVEAGQLVGFPVQDVQTAAQAAQRLRSQGAKTIVIKLGAQGAYCLPNPGLPGPGLPERGEAFFVPAFRVEAIDTVAAGDAFAGGLAVALVEGRSLPEAIRWGCAAGALATTQVGAQVAMSDRSTFNQFLTQHAKIDPSNPN